MSKKTTTTVAPPSPEEKAYLLSQQALAQKQLEVLDSQQDYQKSYLDSIKPLLDQQAQYLQQSIGQQGEYLKSLQPSLDAQNALLKQTLDQQTAAANDPVTQEIQRRSNELQLQQLQQNQDLAPLQKQLLQTQLDQAINGNKPTPEQLSAIDEATNSAYQAGVSDINTFSDDALRQLRDELAPSRGLRPTDTPILDRGGLVQREAVRQAGTLANNLSVANANARLSIPMAQQQIGSAIAGNQASITQAAQQFSAGLADAAVRNRLALFGSGNQSLGLGLSGGGSAGASGAIDSGFGAGIGLANASRENPLQFARGGTSKTSDPWGTAIGLMSGIGSLASGFGKSDVRTKTNIQTDHYDSKGRRWVRFSYKEDPARLVHRGVIAQEVEKTDPQAVASDRHGIKYVNYRRLSKAA